MSIPTVRIFAIIIALAVLSGCASTQKQVENVAKDWCMTIRASQVIPVYPLTEDLQPGDVFLVTVPVQKQVDIYKQKGFLPLDLAVTRLHGLDYAGYYRAEYWAGDFIPPKDAHPRMVRGVGLTDDGVITNATPGVNDDNGGNGGDDADSASARSRPSFDLSRNLGAPRAAFPTYTFRVKKRAGAKLAIPVQGVPIALGFMKTSSAFGSVTISDAYTYAAPTEDLIAKLQDWAGSPGVRTTLSQLEAENKGTTLYLRVVQRVYMTGGVVVSITNERAAGFGGEADLSVLGAAKPKSPEVASGGDAANAGVANADNGNTPVGGSVGATRPAPQDGLLAETKLEDVNDALNQVLSDRTPGASIKFLQASSRSVSMKEYFDRPLVIGYLGFDFPIGEGGRLGVPIATLNQLEKRERTVVRPLLGNDQSYAEERITNILDRFIALSNAKDPMNVEHARQFVITAAKLIDDSGVKGIGRRVENGEIPANATVNALASAVNKYLAKMETEGVGGAHNVVMAVLYEAAKQ